MFTILRCGIGLRLSGSMVLVDIRAPSGHQLGRPRLCPMVVRRVAAHGNGLEAPKQGFRRTTAGGQGCTDQQRIASTYASITAARRAFRQRGHPSSAPIWRLRRPAGYLAIDPADKAAAEAKSGLPAGAGIAGRLRDLEPRPRADGHGLADELAKGLFEPANVCLGR